MTKLQEARSKWLDAETRAMNAENRCIKLQIQVHELNQQLITAHLQTFVESVASFQRGVLAGRAP